MSQDITISKKERLISNWTIEVVLQPKYVFGPQG
jgi:hypothetical protein